MTNHQVIDGVQHPHPPVRQMNHQYSDLNLDDSKEEYKDTDLTSEVYEDQPALYTIDFDKETGLLIASFNRDIEQYLPELNESTNFRMFVYSRSYEEQDRQDSEMVMEIATFLTLIQTAQIDFDEDYVLMRWNSGFDAWAASKFNKHKAKTFLKSFWFVNSLLSKSSRGMHYDENSIDYFRCKFCKSHISHNHVRWLCLHKDCAELEEPFELWNLDFVGGKERTKMPHKRTHEMVMMKKEYKDSYWHITDRIMSQEDFLKQDSKCMQCDSWLIESQKRYMWEDCMPDKHGIFPIFWAEHFRQHKMMFLKHILQKQIFMGICWVDEYSDQSTNKNKCAVCSSDLAIKNGFSFFWYKHEESDISEALILWKKDFLKFNKEGYSVFEMKQWSQHSQWWTSVVNRPSVQECNNSKEFLELLKRSQTNDFGNICITFDPNNFLEFKFIKNSNMISFDSRILKTGQNEFDYLRLLLRTTLTKATFDPPIGVIPESDTNCTICQFDDSVSALTGSKPNQDVKWVCLEEDCQEGSGSQSTLELWDIHFICKYQNDYHTTAHKMSMLQKSSLGGIKREVIWEPLFHFYNEKEYLERFQTKSWSVCDQQLGLRRWHCLEWVEVSFPV